VASSAAGGEPSSAAGGEPSDAGGASSGSGAGQIAACATLLPADEVKSILGVTPGQLKERTFPGTTECYWPYAKDGSATQDYFQFILSADGGDPSLWRATKDSEAREDSKEPIAIDGIGDESYTWTGQGNYRKLYVRRGDTTLVIRADSALPVLSTESTMIDFVDRLFGRA
jgi:hypothetical protein